MALDPGTQLGRYRILRRLGAGAMGEVYLAEDPQIGRELAIKTVRIVAESGHEPGELKERLVREARAAGRLVHPHIVTLFDAGEWEGIFYLAFEFVDGVDLSQRMRGTPPLTVREALVIGRQTAEALDAAHQVGIVHRDIKPANILLDSSGKVKISDFGIAKMVGQQTELTQTGSVVGSPHYLSPEQVRGETLDGRSDLFSLGVVLYEMLTRSRPFEGETITTLVYQILSTDPVPLEDSRPQLPPNLARVVNRLLNKDLAHRFADGSEVARALSECETELPTELLTAPAAGTVAEIAARRASAASRPPTPTPTPSRSPALVPPPPPPGGSGSSSSSSVELDTAATSLLSSKDTAQVGVPSPAAPQPPSATPPPLPPAAAQVAAGPAVPPERRSTLPIVLGAVALLLLLVSVAGFFAFRSFLSPSRPDLDAVEEQQGESQSAADVEAAQPEDPMPADAGEADEPEWREETVDEAAQAPVEGVNTPLVEGQADTDEDSLTQVAAPPAQLEATAGERAETTSGGREEGPTPTLEQQATQPTVVQREEPGDRTSTGSEVVDPPAQNPEELVAEVVNEVPAIEELPVERTLQTSLSLQFDVTPDDTFVLLKEVSERRFISIGRASEWSGKKDARLYDLPGPGEYYLRFRRQGRREVTYRLVADHASGGATPIVLRMP